MAESTELNALMVDLKDETGLVWYNSHGSDGHRGRCDPGQFTTLERCRSRAEEAGLYLIGRLVIFNDPTAAIMKPSMAVWDTRHRRSVRVEGPVFPRSRPIADARAYALALAEEACAMGVDEVQFDYVRFPDQRSDTTVFDGGITEDVRISTIINSFLDEAVALLHPMGCAVGADVFGFTTRAEDDGGIGQRWPDILQIVDVVSPMVYPSHYGTGWYGFDNPNDHPGPMVTNALEDGLARMPRNVVIRPWLQDFGYTADQVTGADRVRRAVRPGLDALERRLERHDGGARPC